MGSRDPQDSGHVPAHVFAGHWTLTPDHGRREAEAVSCFEGRLTPEEQQALLRKWSVDWVWIGPRERSMGGWAREGFAPGCEEVYRLRRVRILRCPAVGPHLE